MIVLFTVHSVIMLSTNKYLLTAIVLISLMPDIGCIMSYLHGTYWVRLDIVRYFSVADSVVVPYFLTAFFIAVTTA